MASSSLKRKHRSTEIPDEESVPEDVQSTSSSQVGSDNSDVESDASMEDQGEEDSADEIQGMRPQKSRQTKKRKIRATGSSAFGATLQTLLNTETASSAPLSLKPSLTRKRIDEKLENKAKRVLSAEKKEKEDRGRITDVIGGWGGESERSLRKVAQRGVVRLFNVVQQSQAQATALNEERKASRGSGKPSLPAPAIDSKAKTKNKGKHKDNIIGRGKEAAVGKDDFFDMLRSGAVVSKA